MRCYKCAFIFILLTTQSIAQNILPIPGKWSNGISTDYIGLWSKSVNRAFLDGKGDGSVSNISSILGQSGDVALAIDFINDMRDEIALYRPVTREIIFYKDNTKDSYYYKRVVGNQGNKIVSGNWDGIAKDGFAVYMPDVRQFWFYQDIYATQPFANRVVGNTGDVPLSGDWNGDGKDGIALYRPSTREIWFWQNYDDAQPCCRVEVGDPGDVPVIGDWNGNGSDGYGVFRSLGDTDNDGLQNYIFWLYNWDAAGPTLTSVTWENLNVNDITAGRQNFYNNGVPHTDFEGNKLTNYNASTSFFPKGIYCAKPDKFQEIYNAGFNLGFLWPIYYPLSDQDKATLDASGNNFRTILYFSRPGGRPFVGKFNGNKDLIGISSTEGNLIAVDTDGDSKPDKQFKPGDSGDIPLTGNWDGAGGDGYALYRPSTRQIFYAQNINSAFSNTIETGNPGDIPLAGNWDGIGGDGYVLYRPSTRELWFFQNYTDTTPFYSRSVGNPGDVIITGNWDGTSGDGFAVYRPSTREFWFYQNYNSSQSFNRIEFGNAGDTPISGDWDGDGKDDIGIYRTTPQKEKHEFWLYDHIFESGHLSSVFFGNPLLETTPKKYVYGIYTADEPTANESVTVSELQNIYSVYSNISNHVFFHVDNFIQSSDSRFAKWQSLVNLGEAIGHDDYPVRSEAGSVKSIGSIAKTVTQARTVTNESIPNWFVPQIFEDVHQTDFKFFKPTPQQFRSMVYTALVHGATGIFDFMYHNPDISSTITGISSSSYTDLWNMSIQVNQELDVLKPYLLSNTPVVINDNTFNVTLLQSPNAGEMLPIRTLLKKNPAGDYILMAVNMTNQQLDAVIGLPSALCPSNRIVQKLFEGNTEVLAGGITDRFLPFGVHIYKIDLGKIGGRQSLQDVSEQLQSDGNVGTLVVYPNPSSSGFTFSTSLLDENIVTIYDASGKTIKRFNSPNSKIFPFQWYWNAQNENGVSVASGLYLYRLISKNGPSYTGKIIIKNSGSD